MVGKVVARIQREAGGGSADKRGDVRGRRAPAGQAQPQAPNRGGEGALNPSFGSKGAGANTFKARADSAIKHGQGIAVQTWRSDPSRVDDPAERRTVAKEQECRLRVRKGGKKR